MSLRNWPSKRVTNPRGAWSLTDQIRAGSPSRSFIAQNMRFSPGRAYSREGTTARAAVGGKVTGAYNFVTSSQNLVLFYEGTGKIRSMSVATAGISDLFTGLSARGITVAEAGQRAYISQFSTAALGASQCRVTDGVSQNDICFAPPLVTAAFSGADTGTGNCTKGTRKIGLVYQSRSGFTGKPGPAPADVFTPISVTTNAGNRTITLTITLNPTPADAGVGSAIYPIMTRTDNLSKYYFVPNVSWTVPASTPNWTITLAISVSDEDLAESATDATNQFNFLSQVVAGTGPFNPSVVFPYRHRTVYIVDNKAYVSEIDNFQAVTEDFNVIQVPGQKRIITGMEIGGALYLMGDKWTAQTSDNGDYPSTWEQPKTIADSGTTGPTCVCRGASGTYGWVANEAGLYYFTGAYPSRPITYLCKEWSTINWNAAYAIQIVDDPAALRCYVGAPTGSATEMTAVFVIDYTNGLAYDTCDISIDAYTPATWSSICRVKESTTSTNRLWIGPSAAGQILVLDPTVHNDNGVKVHPVWESGFLREGELPSEMVRVGGADLRVRGSGTLIHTWYGLDRTLSVAPAALTLSATPGAELFSRFDLNPVENFTVRLETNAVGDWFEVECIKPNFKPSLYRR